MFAIKMKDAFHSRFVAGFNSQHQVMSYTSVGPHYVKKFATHSAAQRFIKKYTDAGYGFSADDVEAIVAVHVPTLR